MGSRRRPPAQDLNTVSPGNPLKLGAARAGAGALIVLALVFCAQVLPADNTNKLWLLYEQGNSAASQKEYGRALQLYKSAIEAASVFPEAEAAIGDVYLEEGETVLAQKQYEKAYDLRKSFYIPEDQYAILYKLANLFELQQLYKQMEDALSTIVAADKRFQETPNQRLRGQVEKNYLEKGLERVIELYRFDESFASAAHSKLGWFYLPDWTLHPGGITVAFLRDLQGQPG